MEHGPLQKGNPVGFLRSDQNIWCRHGYPIRGELRFQWRQQSDVPKLTLGTDIAGGTVDEELIVRQQFPESDVGPSVSMCS